MYFIELKYVRGNPQGDVEKSQGKQPIPIMDRNKMDEQPDSQVNTIICLNLVYYRSHFYSSLTGD